MIKQNLVKAFFVSALLAHAFTSSAQQKPNVLIIYADDLGYGDLSCYGGKINTPNIDKLAKNGLRFTNSHATSATCTPSRFSLMTGTYAWRFKGTGIAPGNAASIIPQDKITLPGVFKKAGYETGIVGKWHLGLGNNAGPDWNNDIKPGPLELGFNYCFLIPATVDRVPTVYVENHRVVNLDPADPIKVDYEKKIGDWPTGHENPELLKMKASHGHDQTIINGIGRIGYMTGGKAALWKDEDIADVLATKANSYLRSNYSKPFFLLVTTHDIHVPRVPHERFAGKSGLGPRGDVILEFDETVGKILNTLDSLKIADNTMVILSSDNGPVIDDGYVDDAVAKLGDHKPSGIYRGGKYSAFDAGTRVPFIVRWPAGIKKSAVVNSLFSQVDLLASFAKLTGTQVPKGDATDSRDASDVLIGKSTRDRSFLIEHANALSILKANWKYIEPKEGQAVAKFTNVELGNNMQPQLYDLAKDPGEKNNLATKNPAKLKELQDLLEKVRAQGFSSEKFVY